MRSAAGKPGRK